MRPKTPKPRVFGNKLISKMKSMLNRNWYLIYCRNIIDTNWLIIKTCKNCKAVTLHHHSPQRIISLQYIDKIVHKFWPWLKGTKLVWIWSVNRGLPLKRPQFIRRRASQSQWAAAWVKIVDVLLVLLRHFNRALSARLAVHAISKSVNPDRLMPRAS